MADAARNSLTRGGMLPRILQSWWTPRQVVRRLAGMPERVMLVVLMVAMLIVLIAQAPMHARAAHFDPQIPFEARIGGSLLAVMFLMPLIAYAVAALMTLLTRLTPWRLAPENSRLALFWALLAVAPAVLLSGLVAGLIGPGAALILTQLVTGIGFIMIWGAGVRALAAKK